MTAPAMDEDFAPPPPPPPPLPHPGQSGGRVVAMGVVTLLGLAALGAPFGWVWSVVSPRVAVVVSDSGPILADPEPEQFAGAEVTFTLIGAGLGVLAAIAVWVLARRLRGPVGLLVTAAGMLAAGLIAWWVGRNIGLSAYQDLLESAPVGRRFDKPVDLRASDIGLWRGMVPYVWGDVLVPAFTAVATYTLLAGWSSSPTLHPEPAPSDPAWPEGAWWPAATAPDGVSWGSAPPQAPPAAPAPPGPGAAAPPPD